MIRSLKNIAELLIRPEFRGLWKSKMINPDGTTEEGWSVTFTKGGDYCEVPYQKRPGDAASAALDILEVNGDRTCSCGSGVVLGTCSDCGLKINNVLE